MGKTSEGGTSWTSLELSPSTMKTLQRLGFSSMTPVQAATIPLFLDRLEQCILDYRELSYTDWCNMAVDVGSFF